MMDKKPKKELIDGIKDLLKDFEVPYDRGEWERFQRQRKSKNRKPIPLFIKIAGIAASLFLMVYASVKILPYFDQVNETEKKVSKQRSILSIEPEQRAKDTLTVDSIPPTVDHINQVNERASKELVSAVQISYITRKEITDIPIAFAPFSSIRSMPNSVAIGEDLKKAMLQTIPHVKDLGRQKKKSLRKSNKSIEMNLPNLRQLIGNSLDFKDMKVGFNVGPIFAEKGISFGGGVSAQIALSNRISTEIGVSYSRIKVGTDMEADKTDTLHLQTIGIRNTIGMVSIPISLNYKISESFSASLAITPFRAVTNRRTDILQSFHWASAGIPSVTGDSIRRLVSERSELRKPDSSYKNNTYLGFVQLSGCISPPFLRKYNSVIAPYIAFPVGGLRDDRYQWIHGGVSFRFYLR